MAGVALYPYSIDQPILPSADHPHERSHQHQTFWRYLSHKQPTPDMVPNRPDVDIRDAIKYYLVEVEVPGVKDVENIKCQWTSSTTLVVSGEIKRPEEHKTTHDKNKQNSDGESASAEKDGFPYLAVGERRIGTFRRHITFSANVDPDKMTAELEAGLLCIKIPKQSHHLPKGDGTVKIEKKG